MAQDGKENFPPQHQNEQPGREWKMHPRPVEQRDSYKGSGKLQGKVALVTGGDSGIGRSVAIYYAREGADVAIFYLNETKDAETTKELVEREGRRCIAISGDVGDEDVCRHAVERTIKELGRLDILVNNAGEQHPQESIEDISAEQLERTFRTDVFGQFYMTKAALKHLAEGSSIINTTSVTAYRGNDHLIDYSSSKGAVVAFTRALARNLVKKGIRVNGVAPGPIWTPLIPSTFSPEKVAHFGAQTPMKRAGEPAEVAPCYVFLASEDASYMTGQILHPDGGEYMST